MKILVYGGCHADVIRRALLVYCADVEACDVIINYQLIASGRPFPYDTIKNYDAVIYSPILNRGPYNTADLRKFCLSSGVLPVCFPWLQWNGYHPEAKKFAVVDWLYQFWGPHSSRPDTEDLFIDEVISPSMREYDFIKNVKTTTLRLKQQEEVIGTDVKVADFIRETYKTRLLFLTPDHPDRIIYQEVMRQIAALIQSRIDEEYFSSTDQAHPEQLLPIIPYVSDCMGLQFSQTSYRNTPALGPVCIDLSDLKRIVFHADEAIYFSYSTSGHAVINGEYSIRLEPGLFVLHRNRSADARFISGSRCLRQSIDRCARIDLSACDIVTKDISAFDPGNDAAV